MAADPQSDLRLVCAVPTRNRSDLARRSVRSVVDAGLPNVDVLVSDNSTVRSQSESLVRFCAEQSVRYIRPAEPLGMTAHWEWMIQEALADEAITHVAILTDRMVFRSGDLARVLAVAASHPERVLSYHQDTVRDDGTPVRVQLAAWSDHVLEVSTQHLLNLSAQGVVHWSLPRMLNCVAPRTVLERICERFGSVFASISPDFCFAYRCLDVEDTIVYLDRAAMIAYGLARSHGASIARGERTSDRADFERELGGPMNVSAPVPDLATIRNAVFNEYCFVRDDPASRRLEPVDPRGYMAAVIEDLSLIEDRSVRSELIDQLVPIGWVAGPRARLKAGLTALQALFACWDISRLLVRRALALGGQSPDDKLWRILGRSPPQALLSFDTSEAALLYADGVRGPRVVGLDHLPALASQPDGPRILA